MQCSTAFYDYLVNCPDGIIVNLVPRALPYVGLTWQITDFHDTVYSGPVLNNEDGSFTIPVADLPAGLLNSYHGTFELTVLDGTTPVTFYVAGLYTSIIFDVRRGNAVKDNLGYAVL